MCPNEAVISHLSQWNFTSSKPTYIRKLPYRQYTVLPKIKWLDLRIRLIEDHGALLVG